MTRQYQWFFLFLSWCCIVKEVKWSFFPQVSPDRPNPRRSHLPNGERTNGGGEHFEEGQPEEDAGRFGHRRRKLHHSILQKADHLRPFRSRRKHASGDFAFFCVWNLPSIIYTSNINISFENSTRKNFVFFSVGQGRQGSRCWRQGNHHWNHGNWAGQRGCGRIVNVDKGQQKSFGGFRVCHRCRRGRRRY